MFISVDLSFAQTIRALRIVTQIINGLQDEIRALRAQLLTSQAPNQLQHSPTTQMQSSAALTSPGKTQVRSPHNCVSLHVNVPIKLLYARS